MNMLIAEWGEETGSAEGLLTRHLREEKCLQEKWVWWEKTGHWKTSYTSWFTFDRVESICGSVAAIFKLQLLHHVLQGQVGMHGVEVFWSSTIFILDWGEESKGHKDKQRKLFLGRGWDVMTVRNALPMNKHERNKLIDRSLISFMISDKYIRPLFLVHI